MTAAQPSMTLEQTVSRIASEEVVAIVADTTLVLFVTGILLPKRPTKSYTDGSMILGIKAVMVLLGASYTIPEMFLFT